MNAMAKEQAETYPLLEFTFPGLDGLSQDAMKTHLELYAGYVKEANEICAALADAASLAGVV